MNLILPFFLLAGSVFLFIKLFIVTYNVVDDIANQPLNRHYLAHQISGLAIALILMGLLGWLIWVFISWIIHMS